MARGFRLDRAETNKAYREGRLTDPRKRSFIGRSTDGSLHDLLSGADKERRYREVMERAKGLCQGCPRPHYVGAMGQWHHVWTPGKVMRCDCLHSALWACEPWHLKEHVRIGGRTAGRSSV